MRKPFSWWLVKEYWVACRNFGWEPTWEGVEAFARIRHLRRLWNGEAHNIKEGVV